MNPIKILFSSDILDKYSIDELSEYVSLMNTVDFLMEYIETKYSKLERDLFDKLEIKRNGK